MEEEFQDRPTDALIFGIEEGDPAATNIQALTKLKQNAEEDRTALAQLALAVIDLVVASFNDDGESPYVRRVLFEGKRKLRLPRLDLDRREIALALGIDPNRISKVKTFIRLQAEGLSYWQLLRQSDDDEPHESNLTKSSGPSGDQPSTPFALGSVRND